MPKHLRLSLAVILALVMVFAVSGVAAGLGMPISNELTGGVDVEEVVTDNVYNFQQETWYENITDALMAAGVNDEIFVTQWGSPYEEALVIPVSGVQLIAATVEDHVRGDVLSYEALNKLDAREPEQDTVVIAYDALAEEPTRDCGTLIEVRAEGVTIAGFVLQEAARRAIWLTGDAAGATIEKNVIEKIGADIGKVPDRDKPYGIYLDADQTGTIIQDNHIINNYGDGIATYRADNFEIIGNDIKDNNFHGIRLVGGANVTITDNVIENNGLQAYPPHRPSGIYVVYAGEHYVDTHDHTITGNTIKGNPYGIAIGYDHGSTIPGHTSADIVLTPTGNTFDSNGIHVMQHEGLVGILEDNTFVDDLAVVVKRDVVDEVWTHSIQDAATATEIITMSWIEGGTGTGSHRNFAVNQYEEFGITINAALGSVDENDIVAVDRVLYVLEIRNGDAEGALVGDSVFSGYSGVGEGKEDIGYHETSGLFYYGPPTGFTFCDSGYLDCSEEKGYEAGATDTEFNVTFDEAGTFHVTIYAVRVPRP